MISIYTNSSSKSKKIEGIILAYTLSQKSAILIVFLLYQNSPDTEANLRPPIYLSLNSKR